MIWTDADYEAALDDDMKVFVERTNSFYPVDTVTRTLAEQREVYDEMTAAFRCPRPAGVETEDLSLPTDPPVPVRRYENRNKAQSPATVVFYHGGGFVAGGLESHDDACTGICDQTGLTVFAVDYRLSPEHPHPAAVDDAVNAFRWVVNSVDGPIILAGDSAGGNLAAAVSHVTRQDDKPPAGQVIIYPALGVDYTLPSYTNHANAPLLSREEVEFYMNIRTPDPATAADPTLWPLLANDFSNLPPTVVFPAAFDPLCDDGAAYCAAIQASGGKAACFVQDGWVHGGLRARHTTQVGARSFERVTDAISMLGRGDWVFG